MTTINAVKIAFENKKELFLDATFKTVIISYLLSEFIQKNLMNFLLYVLFS